MSSSIGSSLTFTVQFTSSQELECGEVEVGKELFVSDQSLVKYALLAITAAGMKGCRRSIMAQRVSFCTAGHSKSTR